MDDNSWLIELESALIEDDCSINEIYAICHGRSTPQTLRPEIWQVCLDVRNKPDQMKHFDEIFDLPFQTQLRKDCHNFVEKLGNDEEEKLSVVSDLESILTFYCKNRNVKYETNNGWIELLLPILSLKLKTSITYNLFESIRDTYIIRNRIGSVFHVFRLLILYHDPELCSILDTKRITPEMYSTSWFQSIFSATCTLEVTLRMWDLYFQETDPFLVFFLSLIMLINGRDQILGMKEESKETIVNFLKNMPSALDQDDVIDFCSLAQYYAMKTPASFKTDLLKALFGAQDNLNQDLIVSQALCLPVSINELVENTSIENTHCDDAVRFFLVDCRPADQYNAGHLSTAFHLDSNLMLQEPVAFSLAVQGLLRAQRQAIDANSKAGGEHLCFMGSGKLQEDQYTHMVVASFLQKNTQYISLLSGGYQAIHDYFGEHMADCLEDHDHLKCLICNVNGDQLYKIKNNTKNLKEISNKASGSEAKPQNDIFSKFSAAMKTKSAEVKEKLFDYIVNPNAQSSNGSHSGGIEKHVSSSEKNGKRYRNVTPVFSIDDDQEESFTNEPSEEVQDNNEIIGYQYLKNPDVINYFKCQEVHMNGYIYDSHLIITKTHLVVLRDLAKKSGFTMVVRRQLSSIVKITAKKRHRDLITFKYGVPENDNLLITDMDRFLIPNATEVTSIISKHIVKQLENNKNT